MSNLSNELARRAAERQQPASEVRKPSGWTPAGIVAIVAALGGPAVIVPLVTAWVNKLEADAEYARRRAAVVEHEQKQMAEDIAAAKRTCGEALDAANTARSRASAAEDLAEQAVRKKRRNE